MSKIKKKMVREWEDEIYCEMFEHPHRGWNECDEWVIYNAPYHIIEKYKDKIVWWEKFFRYRINYPLDWVFERSCPEYAYKAKISDIIEQKEKVSGIPNFWKSFFKREDLKPCVLDKYWDGLKDVMVLVTYLGTKKRKVHLDFILSHPDYDYDWNLVSIYCIIRPDQIGYEKLIPRALSRNVRFSKEFILANPIPPWGEKWNWVLLICNKKWSWVELPEEVKKRDYFGVILLYVEDAPVSYFLEHYQTIGDLTEKNWLIITKRATTEDILQNLDLPWDGGYIFDRNSKFDKGKIANAYADIGKFDTMNGGIKACASIVCGTGHTKNWFHYRIEERLRRHWAAFVIQHRWKQRRTLLKYPLCDRMLKFQIEDMEEREEKLEEVLEKIHQ